MAEDNTWLRIIRKDEYDEFTEYTVLGAMRAELNGEEVPEDIQLMKITIELIGRYGERFDAMPKAERPLCLLCDKPFGEPAPGALILAFPFPGVPATDVSEISVPIYAVCDDCSLPADSMPGRVVKKLGCDATPVHQAHPKVQ